MRTKTEAAQKALAEEKANCRYEVEELENEWSGKNALAIQEADYNKDEILGRMEREAAGRRSKTGAEMEALMEKRDALRSAAGALRERRVAVEYSRVLGKFFEKSSEVYLNAFYDRLRRGNFRQLQTKCHRPV